MKNRVPNYYHHFRCIAGACPDTCCQGWTIIVDEVTWQQYQALPGEIGARLRAALTEQDGEHILTCRSDGRCKMLDDDGLCALQRTCGKQALCQVCGHFPRFSTEIGQNRELGLSLSCPEAARLILTQRSPVTFSVETNQEPVQICHDVDAEFYFDLKKSRDRILKLLQDRSQPLQTRANLVNEVCNRLQRARSRFAKYPMSNVLDTPLQTPYGSFPPTNGKQRHIFMAYLAKRSARRPDWITRLNGATARLTQLSYDGKYTEKAAEFFQYCQDFEILQEQILIYYFNKYLIRAAFDGDIAGIARYCLASWAIVRELAFDDWCQKQTPDWVSLNQQYAAETENDEAGHKLLCQVLRHLPRRKMQDLIQF